MNENIDLTKILKDCPGGTKLYSTLCGEVKLIRVEKFKDAYPIGIKNSRGDTFWLTQDGKYVYGFDGECVLFPSKDQHDWNKFTAPWYKKEKFDHKTLEEKFDHKTLEEKFDHKTLEEKFDHKTLKDDKVLVRGYNSTSWGPFRYNGLST